MSITKLSNETTPAGVLREIWLRGAYDTFLGNPKGGSRHNATIYFLVARGDASICWDFGTGWWPARTRADFAARFRTMDSLPDGLGAIGYHSRVPLYEGATPSDSYFLPGTWYWDHSFTASGELFERMVEAPEVIWPELERRLADLEQRIADERRDSAAFT